MAKGSGKSKEKSEGPLIENRRARHDYAILDTMEVGLVLRGTEVKSLRDGKASLAEGYVRVSAPPNLGLHLHSVNIGEYPPAGTGRSQHTPTRSRSLLAHKREIAKLHREVQQKGVTIIPLKIYFTKGRAKLLIGLAKGKSRYDKRESITKRDMQRDIDRAMSRRA